MADQAGRYDSATTYEPVTARNGALRAGLHGAGLALEPATAQVHRPAVDTGKLEDLCRQILVAIGEDPTRAGLVDTPRRWANWWQEFINHDPGNTATTFEAVEADQMIVVSGMRVTSLCEHHLLPFWCDVSIGYLPSQENPRVLGLSKFARVAHQFAHRLQLQEQLVQQVADEITRLTGSPDVAVIASGRHLCMEMRGVKTAGLMTSSVMRGSFRSSAAARQEFLSMAKRNEFS